MISGWFGFYLVKWTLPLIIWMLTSSGDYSFDLLRWGKKDPASIISQ